MPRIACLFAILLIVVAPTLRAADRVPIQITAYNIDAELKPDVAARIEVRAFETLLMHFAESVGASVIVRGLRAVSDFEYEIQMTAMNARLNPNVETVFLMASDGYQFIASRLVKEIGALGGDISHFVSPRVASRLASQFAKRAQGR